MSRASSGALSPKHPKSTAAPKSPKSPNASEPKVAAATQAPPSAEWVAREIAACSADPAYFIHHYVKLDAKDGAGEGGAWVAFRLWRSQLRVLDELVAHRLLLILKARQIGMSWLLLGFLLWKLVFRPGSAVGLFSKREKEAVELLNRRLKGMHARLPSWLAIPEDKGAENSRTVWTLANGSTAQAFPATGGDSYTFTDALVDEADLCDDLGGMLDAIKPTIDGGGRLVLLSRVNKRTPQSTFKRLCREARSGHSEYRLVFLPWSARPGRNAAWYEAQKAHSLASKGTLDYVRGNYPSTPEEALAAAEGSKRLPPAWLVACFDDAPPRTLPSAPALEGLRIYEPPIPGVEYRVGADPAEGLAQGDDSAAVVVRQDTGAVVAALNGKLEPEAVFPEALAQLARYYAHRPLGASRDAEPEPAPINVERNNHGHAVLGYLHAHGLVVIPGPDHRDGYPKTPATKAKAWSHAAAELRAAALIYMADAERSASPNTSALTPAQRAGLVVRDAVLFDQLASIEAETCKAPTGLHDDLADAWTLALLGRLWSPPTSHATYLTWSS